MFPKEFLLYALEQSRDGIAFINMDGEIDYVNPAWTDMHGYNKQELIGQSASIFYEEMRQGEQWGKVVSGLQQTNFHEVEMDHRKKDGTLFRVWITVNMLHSQDGSPVGYLVNSRDITERQMLEETLRSANELLREQADDLAARNADLDAFSHSVAHDLKNLLATVLGYSEMLLDDDDQLTKTDRTEFVQRIYERGTVMQRVIDNLLLLARLRRSEVELSPVAMQSRLDSALDRLSEMIARIDAVIHVPDSWPVAFGYGPWIEEVWENYLSNGLKYGGTPPHIRLGWEEGSDGFIRFWVKDNGPGISSADQSRLFVPFSRLNQAKAKGHGLGLSIVRRIVEKCGGKVGVEISVGSGSTFWFELPAVNAAQSPKMPDQAPVDKPLDDFQHSLRKEIAPETEPL